MKKLKMAKMKDKKVRGEWAEMKFHASATEHGLYVSKPWGDIEELRLCRRASGSFCGGAGEVHRV